MSDPTEPARRQRIAEINQDDNTRVELEAKHGQVWSTKELTTEFDVIGFMAPYVVASRKSSGGTKGSLEFSHSPRFYFNWMPD